MEMRKMDNRFNLIAGMVENALSPLIDVILNPEEEKRMVEYLKMAKDYEDTFDAKFDKVIDTLIDYITRKPENNIK
jgi:hypothetical protein